MKILFAATRSWDDEAAVSTILDEVTGIEPVHIVTGYETRGPEAWVVDWARRRARRGVRTFIDVLKADKSFGMVVSERRPRRDAHMISMGGYDLAIILNRKTHNGSDRPMQVAEQAEDAGIKTLIYYYGRTPRTEGIER